MQDMEGLEQERELLSTALNYTSTQYSSNSTSTSKFAPCISPCWWVYFAPPPKNVTDKFPTWFATISLTFEKSNLPLQQSLEVRLDAPWSHDDKTITYSVGTQIFIKSKYPFTPSNSDEVYFKLWVIPPTLGIKGGFVATLLLTGSATTLSPTQMPSFQTYTFSSMSMNSTSISIWFFVILTFVSLCAYRVFRTHRLNQMMTRRERGAAYDDEQDGHVTMSPIVTAVYPSLPPQAEVHVVRVASATTAARAGSSSPLPSPPRSSSSSGTTVIAAASAAEGHPAETTAEAAEAEEGDPPIATAIATPVSSPRRL